jgi:hypothetical protein
LKRSSCAVGGVFVQAIDSVGTRGVAPLQRSVVSRRDADESPLPG